MKEWDSSTKSGSTTVADVRQLYQQQQSQKKGAAASVASPKTNRGKTQSKQQAKASSSSKKDNKETHTVETSAPVAVVPLSMDTVIPLSSEEDIVTAATSIIDAAEEVVFGYNGDGIVFGEETHFHHLTKSVRQVSEETCAEDVDGDDAPYDYDYYYMYNNEASANNATTVDHIDEMELLQAASESTSEVCLHGDQDADSAMKRKREVESCDAAMMGHRVVDAPNGGIPHPAFATTETQLTFDDVSLLTGDQDDHIDVEDRSGDTARETATTTTSKPPSGYVAEEDDGDHIFYRPPPLKRRRKKNKMMSPATRLPLASCLQRQAFRAPSAITCQRNSLVCHQGVQKRSSATAFSFPGQYDEKFLHTPSLFLTVFD